MEDGVCEQCGRRFERGNKGWKRRSCHLITPGKPGFYCLACFSSLSKKTVSKSASKRKAPGTPIKRKYTRPLELSPDSHQIVKNLSWRKYRPAINTLLAKSGFHTAVINACVKEVRNELEQYTAKQDALLRRPLTLTTLKEFNWIESIYQLSLQAPTTMKLLINMLTKPTPDGSVPQTLLPTLGVVIAVILNNRQPIDFRLLQNMMSLQMYKCGSPQKLITVFNKLHLSAGPASTRKLIDRIISEYQGRIIKIKNHIESLLQGEHEGNCPRTRQQLVSSEKSQLSAQSYTFCWDNTQIDVKAREQTKDKNVWQRLWALCYATPNRVRTLHLSDDPPSLQASGIPIKCFLPTTAEKKTLFDWLTFHIKEILVEFLPAFKCLNERKPKAFIVHAHWEEMAQKSEIINLGVVQENPSTTDGAIGIMEFLTTKVPLYPDGRPFPIITHCDGGAFERMVGARKVRAADRGPLRQLLSLEPSAQEFHKRGIMLQTIMDIYFKGSSKANRGTLANIKAVMGHHSVKAKVMDSFNHVESMFDMICDGMTCLLAMKILGQDTFDQELTDVNTEEKQDVEKVLQDTTQEIIQQVWLHARDSSIQEVVNAVVPPTNKYQSICCGQEVGGDTVLCSNPDCPSGGKFHSQCIEVITGEIPPMDEDWWCSEACQGWSKFCTCRKYKEGESKLECGNRKHCDHGRWFHLSCLGLEEHPKGEMWHCPGCIEESVSDGIYQYSVGLLWMLLNDKLRRTAIRNGDGPMMMQFWKHDGIEFWNQGHNKYLILMHRMTAGVNGWLSQRQANDLTWNRTANIRGGAGHNIAMDKVNEFLNNEFKSNLKTCGGKYTDAQVKRSSFLAGSVGQDLDRAFSLNVAGTEYSSLSRGKGKHQERVLSFMEEFQEDKLFQVSGRQHSEFPNFNARKIHRTIKKPSALKSRLELYSWKLDRARNAATTS